jgi:hypothetical protein
MLYKNMTMLDIELEAGISLDTASLLEIIVLMPDNKRKTLPATANGTKMLYLNPQDQNPFDQEGNYQFQGRFVIDGREGKTGIIYRTFHRPI